MAERTVEQRWKNMARNIAEAYSRSRDEAGELLAEIIAKHASQAEAAPASGTLPLGSSDPRVAAGTPTQPTWELVSHEHKETPHQSTTSSPRKGKATEQEGGTQPLTTSPEWGKDSSEALANDICNRLWNEITPHHPASVREIAQVITAYTANLLAASPSHAPTAAKRPIDRPCSACSGGDYKMEYHDHEPPFADEARASAPPTNEAPLNKSEQFMAQHGWTFGESIPPTCSTCGSTDRSVRRSGCRAAQENMWHSQPSAEGAKEGK